MNAYVEIQADDPERAIAFYAKIFGWKFTRMEGFPIPYWSIEGGGGLLKRPAKTPPPEHGTNAFVCSFEVKSFDEAARAIEKAGGIVAMPKFAVPKKCWQGYFVDPEG